MSARPPASAALLAALLCAVLAAAAQERNPYENDGAAISAGASFYAARCAECHGPDAKGNRGPDLTQRWTRGETDASAFRVIRTGVAGTIMPPSIAPDNELWAIVAHLRSISVQPPLASTGNAERGRALFDAECADCHQVRGSGGAFGPSLTTIGASRSRAALTAALREPSATVAPGFRAVALRTRRGERMTGLVKAEDAFSLQLVTADGALRAFAKRELAELVREEKSAMPVFAPPRLSDAALEDLLAYLGTLRSPVAIQ